MPSTTGQLKQLIDGIHLNNIRTVQQVLGSRHLDLNQRYRGQLALVEAVSAGVDFVQALMSANADLNAHDEEDRTPLIKAAQDGNVLILKMLLQAGADPNLMTDNVTSPLWAAASVRSRRHLEALRTLIRSGADVNSLSRSLNGSASCTILL